MLWFEYYYISTSFIIYNVIYYYIPILCILINIMRDLHRVDCASQYNV